MEVMLWIAGLVVVAVLAWSAGRRTTKKGYAQALARASRAFREGDAEGVRRAGAGQAFPGLRELKEVLLRKVDEEGTPGPVGAASVSQAPEAPSVEAPSKRSSGEGDSAAGAGVDEGDREAFMRRGLERISSYLREGVEAPLRSRLEKENGELEVGVEDALVAVEDLYFYLRRVPEDRTREDLNELAREAADEYREEWDAEVDVHVPERPTRVEVNREAFLDALYLILHNAGSFGDGEVEVVVRYQDGDCWLVVRDEGEGFTEEALERGFEPFYSTADLGLGLGLYHARKIIQAMGGRIALRNRRRGGGQVEIVLPEPE